MTDHEQPAAGVALKPVDQGLVNRIAGQNWRGIESTMFRLTQPQAESLSEALEAPTDAGGAVSEAVPVPVTIFCPVCAVPHVDEDEWATTRHHKTHQCQGCGHEWRPFPFATVGIPHPSPQPLQQGGEVTREHVARIIAPDAWREYDDEVRDCKLWGEDLNPVPSPDRLSSTRSSLKTADAILALFASPDLGDLAGRVGLLVRDLEKTRDKRPVGDPVRAELESHIACLRSLAADRDKAVELLRRLLDKDADHDGLFLIIGSFLSSQTEEK